MTAAVWVSLVAGLMTALLWLLRPSRTKRMVDKIPGPPAWPLVGNALELKHGTDFYDQVVEFCELFKEFPLCRLLIGPQVFIVIYKAEAVETLLSSSKNIRKSPEYRFLTPWVGTGLLTSTGEKWRSRRRLLTPTFHFRILEDFLQVFNEQSRTLLAKLQHHAAQGQFDIYPVITLCTLDIICETAMGKVIDAQGNKDYEYVNTVIKISELIHRRFKAPWLWPDSIYKWFPTGRQHQKCLDTLHNFTNKVIRERGRDFDSVVGSGSLEQMDVGLLKAGRRLAFLDMLLYGRREAGLTDEDIREEVDTFMEEGHDTTAAALSWGVHLIAAHPHVQAKLHREIDSIFGDSARDCTMEDVKSLKYMECVIKEILRLFPSLPLFARELLEDCEIGGYVAPKGATAIVVTSALHRDERFFPDPEKFDPDRFLPENAVRRHPFSYVPFSAGLRNCIGQKFAMNEIKVVLTHLLRHYTLTAHQTREQLQIQGDLVLRSQNGILVSIKPRER